MTVNFKTMSQQKVEAQENFTVYSKHIYEDEKDTYAIVGQPARTVAIIHPMGVAIVYPSTPVRMAACTREVHPFALAIAAAVAEPPTFAFASTKITGIGMFMTLPKSKDTASCTASCIAMKPNSQPDLKRELKLPATAPIVAKNTIISMVPRAPDPPKGENVGLLSCEFVSFKRLDTQPPRIPSPDAAHAVSANPPPLNPGHLAATDSPNAHATRAAANDIETISGRIRTSSPGNSAVCCKLRSFVS